MSNGNQRNDGRQDGKLLILDGHAYAYRAFHAIRQLASPSGTPTNAVYGFIKMFGKLLAMLRPSHLVVVWDGGLAADRLVALPEYKAQRAPMPPALEAQLDEIVEYLKASGVASHCQDGVEADDWIATLSCRASSAGLDVVIASSDKDFMQLVAPRVGLFNPNDKSETIWGAEQVRARTGLEPWQIVDWLSLVGDAVDNIPGVAGVGTKTATELLQRFGSVDELFARLDEVKSERLRAALQSAAETVRRNQGLIRLRDELLGEVDWKDFLVRCPDSGRLRALYERWGFKTMLAELERNCARQGDLFGGSQTKELPSFRLTE